MSPSSILLAILVAVLWGFGFVVAKYGLQSFSAIHITVLRFVIAALPALFLPRPAVPWPMLLLIGLTLFIGQSLLLMFALKMGMPPGLGSITQQTQVFMTIALSAIFMRDIPKFRHIVGVIVASVGLVAIAATVGGDVPFLSFILAIGAALSWSIGNVLVRRLGNIPMLPLMTWLSVIPPAPVLVLGAFYERQSIIAEIANASWISLAAVVYMGLVGTFIGYALWNRLLARYPSSLVAPFSLITPCTGIIAAMILFGEQFDLLRIVGMVLIILGLSIILVPEKFSARFFRLPPSGGA